MPRKAKMTKSTPAPARSAGGINKLTISMPDMNLTVEAVDASLIASILDKLDIASGSVGAAPRARAAAAAAPVKRGKAAAPAVSTPRGSKVTRADIQQVFRNANASNHEQRILLLGLAVRAKGLDRFSTDDIKSNADAIGVSHSTIPGSLSKLRAAGLIGTSREGRRAFYTLTAKGAAEAERVRDGHGTAPRRGRRKAGAAAPAVSAAPKRRGRPPKAASAVAAAAGVKLKKDGTPRKKPGPKPKGGPKPAKAPKAADRKARGNNLPERREPTTLNDLSPDDQAKAKALENATINGDPGALTRLRTPKERSLWVLQSLGSAVSGGVRATVISCVLKSRFNLDVPANAVGAALKKSSQAGLVAGTRDEGYTITLDGRKYLESAS
jgi:DNA-binding PadR family transcriptional regulator